MKKFKIKNYLIAILAAVTITFSANAFLLPPGPGTPTVAPIEDALFFLNTAQTAIQNATAQASAFVQNINQQAKALVEKYVGKFTGFMNGIFKKKEKQPLPGTKKIQESKVADIYDPASVQAAMYDLFFQFPADCTDTTDIENIKACENYKALAGEFYQDTIIELYTSTRELEKNFETLETSIKSIEENIASGQNGAESPEDENGVWKNAYNVYETMNSILKIIQEIQAMRAQYIAAQAIGGGIVYPALPEKEDSGKEAMNVFIEEKTKVASSYVGEKLTLSFANKASEEKKPTYKRAVNFKSAPAMKVNDPFAANSENMALLENVYDAYGDLQDALEMHNQIKTLSGIQLSYSNYNKAKKIHNKILESLKEIEQCTIDYYGNIYSNARQMWNGGLSEQNITNHDLRKGISGWAVKAFNLAKAEDTGFVVETEDFAESGLDTTNVDSSDLSQISKIGAKVDKNQAKNGFKNSSKSNEINESLKETARIAWNIGSEAARMLATDQAMNGKNGKWGNVHTSYPVWNDTKEYYNQYIDGKYDNIIRQLELINTNEVALKIASEINDLIASSEEKSNNEKGLSRLKSKIASEKSPTLVKFENIISAKKQALDNLYNQKEEKISQLMQQRKDIERQIDNLQKKLDALNVKRQIASDELKRAEVQVSTMETLVDSIIKREYDLPEMDVSTTSYQTYEKVFDKHSYNLQGLYQSKEVFAHAQLASISFIDEEPKDIKNNSKEVRTYVREVETEESVDYDEPNSLLLAKHSLEEGRQKVLTSQQTLKSLDTEIAQIEKQQQELRAIISDKIEPEIASINSQYVIDVNQTTIAYDKKLSDEGAAYRAALRQVNSIDLASYYYANFRIPTTNEDGTVYLFSLPDVLRQANSIVRNTEGAAQEMIKNAVKRMYALGDNLYNPKYHSQVVKYHQDLMENLKDIPSHNISSYGYSGYYGYSGIMKLASTMYQSYMVNDACVRGYCQEVDIEYFVSSNGKRRDFQAPKSVPTEVLPTVRETVYFDYSDYDNVPTSATGMIAGKDFLEHLTYIPEVWKLMLTSPAYVEKDIDLSVVKSSEDMFANGGVYPCVSGSYLVLSNGNGYTVHYRKKYDDEDLQKAEDRCRSRAMSIGYMSCRDLKVTRSGNHFTVKNISENVSGSAYSAPYCSFSAAHKNSELGYLLQYSNGLRYNNKALKALSTLSKANKDGVSGGEQALVLYDYASLNRNQIGEFLNMVDLEQETKQNLDEAKQDLDTSKQSLFEMFAKIGFTPSASFDLSKDSDYNLAKNTLLRHRNKLLSSAISKVSSLQNNSNDVIRERLEKINNIIGALKKDNDVYVSLSENAKDDSELDEAIKMEKSNREVMAKYQKEEENNFNKQLEQIGNVYCAQLTGNI